MRENVFLLLAVILTASLTGSIWGQVTLEVEPTCFRSPTGNVFNFSMNNPKDEVAALQVDILFDTECFIVTDVTKTSRSAEMDIFNYAHIEGGLRLAMTGIDHSITPGTGPIAKIIMDLGECPEWDYVWDVTGCVVADPLGGGIVCYEVDNSVPTCPDECILDVSEMSIDMGDVHVGKESIALLTVTNIGVVDGYVTITIDGCASVDLTAFILDIGSSQEVIVFCRPEEEGPGEGMLALSCDGDREIEVSVTCNGVIPTGTKGDVNNDSVINILDVVIATNIALGIHVPTPEEAWAADCNGPIGNCDGDGVVDVLDVMKIVSLTLDLDECLPKSVIYFNSFESAEDTTGWYGIFEEMFVGDPAPGGGRQSLYIGGGCIQPSAYIDLPQQPDDGYYTVSCWGKSPDRGIIVLMTTEASEAIDLIINSPEWELYDAEESLYCPSDEMLRLEIWIGGYIPERMFVDCIKVEKVE